MERDMGRFVNGQLLEELKQILSEEQILTEEPMSRHTTFRVGGPAEVLAQPECEQISAVVGGVYPTGYPIRSSEMGAIFSYRIRGF